MMPLSKPCLLVARWIVAFGVLAAAAAFAAEPISPGGKYESQLRTVRKLLQQPDADIDLAKLKVAIDHMIEPKVDQQAVLLEMDRMAAEVRSSLAPHASNLDKFKALRDYLYRPPLLSGRKPFRYDFENFMSPRSKLMSVYLETHRGNCISMPVLLVILGQKLGIPLALTTAPAHVYVKFRADNGTWHGIEATSGAGWADDDWQRSQFPRMTQTAIDNGIYMQPLSQRESAAVIADSLLEFYENQHTLSAERARVEMALLILQHYPKNVVAMVHAYLGMRQIRQRLFVEKYPTPADIPFELWPQFERLERESLFWGNKAKSLGYMASTPEMDAAYREKIKRAQIEHGIK